MERWEFNDLLIERMENLYGKNILDVIVKRYLREKNYLQLSEFQKEFRVFAELLLEMKKMKMRYSVIGTTWHSFLLWLLVEPELNPLPPHYYCPRCKDVVFVENKKEISMGIDLPEKQCKCGYEMIGDGFNLSEEFFWEKEQLDLGFSVSEIDYEYVKNWLCEDRRLQDKEIIEEEFAEEDITKRFCIGIITVLCEKCGVIEARPIRWNDVRKRSEKVIDNYKLLLPENKKIRNKPRSLYEVIRVVAFFNTMYTKSTNLTLVREDEILDATEMNYLLENLYDGDINKAPVFLEDGLFLGEWNIDEYNFLILFTRSFAEYVLEEINDKMRALFEEVEIDEK